MTETTPVKENLKPGTESPYLKLWMEGDILCAAYANNLHVTLEIAKEVVAQRILYSENKSHLCFVDMRGVRSATREAREYLAAEGSSYVICGAMLVDSVLTRTIGNIFLKVNKPKIAIRLFTDKNEALEWLRQQLKHYQQ